MLLNAGVQNAPPTFQAVNVAVGNDPSSVAVGDLNGDGKPDLAVANNGSDNVSVLLNAGVQNGQQTFQAAVNVAVGTGPRSVAVGDLNGDGKPDLAVANFKSDNVSVLLNAGVQNGQQTFQVAVNVPLGTPPRTWGSGPGSVAVGDLNGDGKPDLSVANYISSNVSVILGSPTIGSAEVYDAGTRTWAGVGYLASARHRHAAVRLGNGNILMSGGIDTASQTSTDAEWYDPTQGTWATQSSMSTGRSGHTATALQNGNGLVVGGSDSNGAPLKSTELFDLKNRAWNKGSDLKTARDRHSASALLTGEVLVAGGSDGVNPLATVERYDPMKDQWTAAASLSVARWSHTATVLQDGRVLVAGGTGNGGIALATCEIYDPVKDEWKPTDSLKTARTHHGAALLANGAVLVAGGDDVETNGNPLAAAELFDPRAGKWVSVGPMAEARSGPGLVGTESGLVIGGKFYFAALGSVEEFRLSATPGDKCAVDGECGLTQQGGTGYCDQQGFCVARRANAQPCTASNQCISLFCADDVCCNTACSGGCDVCSDKLGAVADGICTKLPPGNPGQSCSPFLCDGVSRECPRSCTNDGNCVVDHYCNIPKGMTSGVCDKRKDIGVACTAKNECASGFCSKEQLCCDRACDGACESCNLTGSEGACTLLPAGTPAGCGAYLCSGASSLCPVSCALDGDCAPGHFCAGDRTCRTVLPAGDACDRDRQCEAGGLCVLGTCCGEAGCPQGARCGDKADCASGFCVDGFCCDAACGESCRACSLPGKVGVCSIVTGVPVGARSCPGSGACAGYCNGTDASCASRENDVCAVRTCVRGVAVGDGRCDKSGACIPGSPETCRFGCAGDRCAAEAPPGGCAVAGHRRKGPPEAAILVLIAMAVLLRDRRRRRDP